MSGYKRERAETKEWRYRKEDKKEGNREGSEKTVKREEKEKGKDTAGDSADGQLNDKKRQTKEHLDKSDLTEETGLVINPQNSCYSSGSTQNSLNTVRQTRSGNIIRISLAKRYKENGQDTAGGITDVKLNAKKGQAGESLEKSDLTDENRLAANSQNSCHSSDSTQNSLEKEGHTSITSGSTRHGPIIRIRLPVAKPNRVASLANVQRNSERLPLQKDCGLGASINKERSCSIEQPLSEHGQRPSLKRKQPEASIIKEESSLMRLPHSKLRKLETSQRVEGYNTSVRVDLPAQKFNPRPDPQPLLKHGQLPSPNQPDASIRKEKSSLMLPRHSKLRDPETSRREESCSIPGRADLPAQKINPRPDPQALSEHGQLPSLKRKQAESSIIKKKISFMRLPHSKLREPETSRREESCSTSGRADLPAQKINPRADPRPLSEHGQLPSLKREQPEASIRKEKSSFMRPPHSKLREPETSGREESCSTSGRADSSAKKINLRPDPQPLSEHGQLPSLKHKESEASIIKKKSSSMRLPDSKLREPETSRRDESCSTSERSDSPAQKINLRPDQQLPLTTSAAPGIVVHDDDACKNKTSRSSGGIVAHDDASGAKKGSKSKKQSVEELYEALVVNWVHPPLQPDLEEDLEWLFPKPGDRDRTEQRGDKKKPNVEMEVKYDMHSRGWRIHWNPPKPDVVYALPYTIPY